MAVSAAILGVLSAVPLGVCLSLWVMIIADFCAGDTPQGDDVEEQSQGIVEVREKQDSTGPGRGGFVDNANVTPPAALGQDHQAEVDELVLMLAQYW